MLVNSLNTNTVTAFNSSPAQNVSTATPSKAQAYQAQTKQAVQAPNEKSEPNTNRPAYGKDGQLFAEERGSNIDLLV